MARKSEQLSRRERQIMDVLYADGESSPAHIAEKLPDPPTSTAVRTMLRILMGKNLVKRRKVGREFLYQPRSRRETAGQSALDRVVDTFFDGSLDQALAAYLSRRGDRISDEEYKQLARLIRDARKKEG